MEDGPGAQVAGQVLAAVGLEFDDAEVVGEVKELANGVAVDPESRRCTKEKEKFEKVLMRFWGDIV